MRTFTVKIMVDEAELLAQAQEASPEITEIESALATELGWLSDSGISVIDFTEEAGEPEPAKEQAAGSLLKEMFTAFDRLQEMMLDCINGGRLKESDIPDDFQAVYSQLEGPCTTALQNSERFINSKDQKE